MSLSTNTFRFKRRAVTTILATLTYANTAIAVRCQVFSFKAQPGKESKMESISRVRSAGGKWVFSPESDGAKLGWSSGGAKDELDGIVFVCSEKSASIEVSIDLSARSPVGKKTNISLSGAKTRLQASSIIQDGMNGPNASLFSQTPSIMNLLNERSTISIQSSFEDIVSYPPAPETFNKFIVKCGGKVTPTRQNAPNDNMLVGDAEAAAGGPAATPFVGRWHYVGARFFDFQKDGVFVDRNGGSPPLFGGWRLVDRQHVLIQEGHSDVFRCAFQMAGNRMSFAFCPLTGLMDKVAR